MKTTVASAVLLIELELETLGYVCSTMYPIPITMQYVVPQRARWWPAASRAAALCGGSGTLM